MPLIHSNETLAYVAGLFDGEGCVNFTHSGQSRTLVLRTMVRNTDYDVIKYLKETFGGRIEAAKRRGDWKQSFCWRLDGAAAIDFLYLIEPWVRIKHEQIFVAKVYDAVRNVGTGKYYNAGVGYHDMLELLHLQLKWLNRKGRRAPEDREPIEECLSSLPISIDRILSELDHAAH